MDATEMKQTCLDLSRAATNLYDIVDGQGIDAPMDELRHILTLQKIVAKAEEIRAYYFRRNVQRMLALGVSPESLNKMVK